MSQCRPRSQVEQKQIIEQMGGWLGSLAPWDVFATWTFSRIVTTFGAMQQAKKHLKWMTTAANQHVYGFYSAERGKSGGLIHVHALLGNVAHMAIYCGTKLPVGLFQQKCCLTHAWHCGYARVFPYNAALGGKHYVAKYIIKAQAEWELFGLPMATQTAFAHKGAEFVPIKNGRMNHDNVQRQYVAGARSS